MKLEPFCRPELSHFYNADPLEANFVYRRYGAGCKIDKSYWYNVKNRARYNALFEGLYVSLRLF